MKNKYCSCCGRLNETPVITEDHHDFGDGKGVVAARRHTNPDGSEGGWVANTAWTENTTYVGKWAQVFGEAKVCGEARVCGEAKVSSS